VDGTSEETKPEESESEPALPAEAQPPAGADGTDGDLPSDAAGVAAGPDAVEVGPQSTGTVRDGTVSPANGEDAGDDDEPVLPVQAYRDRASYTPERYLLVRPLSEEGGVINPEVVERITSVLRQRSPSLAEPEPAA